MEPLIDSATRELADIGLAKRFAEVLDRHYPGHLWGVRVDSGQGIAVVFNLGLSGRWGFMLKLRELTYEGEIAREVMLAGGELLERYRLSRGRFKEDEYAVMTMTPTGSLIADGV
jgi:hypothetical protein